MSRLTIAAALLSATCLMADEIADRFTMTSKRATDVVAVTSDKDEVIFDVTSPYGISQTTIARKSDAWPKAVLVRLRLKGLENFKVSNGKIEAEGACVVRDGKPGQRMWTGEEESPIDDKNPLWIKVGIVGEEKKAFELPLPPVYFEGNPKSITIRWIDFYR